MGCIYKTARLSVSPEAAWDVVERYTRAAAHVFSDAVGERMEGDYRVVTMSDGNEVHELNVSIDPHLRRAAYTIPGIPGVEHHHAVMQVTEDSDGGATLVWATDIRPDEIADRMASMYDGLFVELRAAVEGG